MTLIDWTRVTELREEIGPEDFAEVAEMFLEEVDEVILRLRDGTHAMPLADELHFLKGSALNLGFAAFAGLCRDGEATAARESPGEVDLSRLLATYDASRAAFLSKL